MDWYFALCDLDLRKDTGETAYLQNKLKDEVRTLYGLILLFLIKSICSYQRNRLHDNTRLALKVDDWEGSLGAVKAAETMVGKHLEVYRNRRAHDLASRKEIADRLKQLPFVAGALFDSDQLEDRKFCKKGTRTTFLAMVRAWAMCRTSKPIFWLCGLAGTGKSTISLTVARELSRLGFLGASFFFLRGGGDLADASKLIPTLAFQLANRVPGAAEHMSEAIANHPNIVSSNKKKQWEHLIKEPLSHLADDSSSPIIIVIVIDALDECANEDAIRLLLGIFSNPGPLRAVQLRFFLTSRPELPIRLKFKEMANEVHEDVILHEVLQEETHEDIKLYLSKRLAKISKKHRLPLDWVDEENFSKLVHNCGDLFIYASTVCQFIDQTYYDPKEQLAKVLASEVSGPTSYNTHLDRMYEVVLQNVVNFKEQMVLQEREKLLHHFRMVVGSIVLLLEPLSTGQLAKLLDMPVSLVHTTTQRLSAILNVPDCFDSSKPLGFLHLSFRDFLIDKKRCKADGFWVDPGLRRGELAKCCFRVMAGLLKHDICNLKLPGYAVADIEDAVLRACIPEELRYACRYWVQHIHDSDHALKTPLLESAYSFVKEHFLHWVEVLALLGGFSKAILMLRDLRNLLMVSHR